MEHHFDTDIAKEYGVPEAIILYNLAFWIRHNQANNKCLYDGKYWTYNSTKAFTELFPYYTYWQVHRALKHLEEAGVIVTGNYNKMPMDKTLWYSLTDLGETLCIKPKCNLQKTKIEFGKNQNGICIEPKAIPNNNIDNNKDISILEQKLKKKKQFIPPTFEQVKAYAAERNSTVNPQNFYDYYNAADWVDAGGKAIKSWKQKFITWEMHEKKTAAFKPNAQSKVPEAQIQRFRNILAGNDWHEWTDIEKKVVSALGYQELKLRKAGEEDKWLERLCAKFIELGG